MATRNHFPNETAEQRRRRLAEKQRLKRVNEKDDQRSKRLISEAARQRNRRAKETEAEHLKRIAANRTRYRNNIANETEEDRAQRLQNEAARKRNRRAQASRTGENGPRVTFEEPPRGDVVSPEASVDPLFIKTEQICREGDGSGASEELQLIATSSLVKAEPLDVLQDGAVEQQQDFHWAPPGFDKMEDCKPLQEHSGAADISEHGSTQPFHERWALWMERGPPGLVKLEPLDPESPGREEKDGSSGAGIVLSQEATVKVEPLDPDSQDREDKDASSGAGIVPSLEATLKVEPFDGESPDREGKDASSGTGIFLSQETIVGLENAEAELCRTGVGCGVEPVILGLPHDGGEALGCNLCQLQFRHRKQLKKHLRGHINAEKYRCKACGKQFGSLSNLSRHGRTHTGEKPFLCDVCNVPFTTSYNLSRHRITHTGEKRFYCEACNIHFSSSSNLIRHCKKHGRESVPA